ncbi:unnamed protein product [Prunus armeniaca]
MGTTSGPQFLSEDGLPYGMPSGASPTLHPSTPFGNPPVLQTTVEVELLAQMTSLRREMAKLQEHNSLLSSKTLGLQKKGKKGAKATPAPSKQLVVPAPQDQPQVPKKVYTDCRHRINDKKDAKRHRSPIRVNARLRDSKMKLRLGRKIPFRKGNDATSQTHHFAGIFNVITPLAAQGLRDVYLVRVGEHKSPLRKVQGLDLELGSDDEYVPSKGTESNYRSESPPEYSKARPPSLRRTSEYFSSEEVPSQDPAICLVFQRIQKMEDD